jgi:hypothetical protein
VAAVEATGRIACGRRGAAGSRSVATVATAATGLPPRKGLQLAALRVYHLGIPYHGKVARRLRRTVSQEQAALQQCFGL